MPTIHELLSVSKNLEGQSTKCAGDLRGQFEKKRHLFEQKISTFQPAEEGAAAVTESQSDIQTTVGKELDWFRKIFVRSIDVNHQLDMANMVASADIITEDGKKIAEAVPATSLLQLEKELKDFHDLIATIPTLDPAKGFMLDDTRDQGVYKARDVQKVRTKKAARPITLAPATKEHPAQVQLITEDVPVGTIREQEWSALLTPAMKSDPIDRAEVLIRAVKRARSRANEMEINVASHAIGTKLLDYVLEPLVG